MGGGGEEEEEEEGEEISFAKFRGARLIVIYIHGCVESK